jgi:microcystin-dependent protein
MAQPFIGEIRMVGFNFAPVDWALCNGALQSIANNPTLFNLIGTTYGGDGQTTYALPNLQSRIAIHQGTGPGLPTYVIGQSGGVENVTLNLNQIPSHSHSLLAQAAAGSVSSPSGAVWAESALNQYSNVAPTNAMAASALQAAGGSQPHNNLGPFLVINFIIAMFGIYPSQA